MIASKQVIIDVHYVENNEEVFSLSYPFIKSDGGRSQAKVKLKHQGDCCIRALAIASGASYDDCFEALDEDGGASKRFMGVHFDQFVHSLSWNEKDFHGYNFKWISFPAKKGERRMNPGSFCRLYPKGRFIARTANHVFAIVDGILYDSWEQRPDRCIYGVWELQKA